MRANKEGSIDLITWWLPFRKKSRTDSWVKHHTHTLEFLRKYSWRKITSLNLLKLLNSSNISVRNDKHMFGGSCLRFWGQSCLDSSLSVSLSFESPLSQWFWERESSFSINSCYRFFSIISIQSPGPISCLRGSWKLEGEYLQQFFTCPSGMCHTALS